MNSSSAPAGRSLVEVLIAALREDHLHAVVDLPIDRVAAGFQCSGPRNTRISTRDLLAAAGTLVQRIYRHGIRPARQLTREQAVAEAIQIIEEGYQSVACRGFSAFMLDGRAPDPGPEGVLLSLAGIVKAREREKYRASLIARILDPLDWDERVRATARLRSLLSERLPEDVRCQTAGILATAFRDLLDLRVGVMDELSRMGSALSTD